MSESVYEAFESWLNQFIEDIQTEGLPAIEWLRTPKNNLLEQVTKDLSHDDLIRLLNKSYLVLLHNQKEMLELQRDQVQEIEDHQQTINESKKNQELWENAANVTGAMAYLRGEKDGLSFHQKKAINSKHDKPNGSRDKRKQIQEIWATGKYSSRSICAEQECAGLGMSYDAARKALRNTPDPT